MHSDKKQSVVALFFGILLLTGCTPVVDRHPLDKKFLADDSDSQLDFWHTLATKKLATHDESFHALILYLDSHDQSESYQDRKKVMMARRMLPSDFSGQADEAITRGTISVAISKILQIKGGVMMHLLNNSPRYACRELQNMGVLPQSSPNQVVSGAELVGIIGKLEDFQSDKNGAGK